MDLESEPLYKNLVSHMDLDRNINSIEHFNLKSIEEPKFSEFHNDMSINNNAIELSLIKNNAYKEAVILKIKKELEQEGIIKEFLKEEQKTFGGNKLFYLNQQLNKILIMAVPGSLEGKIRMVIQRLNKINDRVYRLNAKIKKDNFAVFKKRIKMHDTKDKIIDSINKNLRI